jgi:hypothetical protein
MTQNTYNAWITATVCSFARKIDRTDFTPFSVYLDLCTIEVQDIGPLFFR